MESEPQIAEEPVETKYPPITFNQNGFKFIIELTVLPQFSVQGYVASELKVTVIDTTNYHKWTTNMTQDLSNDDLSKSGILKGKDKVTFSLSPSTVYSLIKEFYENVKSNEFKFEFIYPDLKAERIESEEVIIKLILTSKLANNSYGSIICAYEEVETESRFSLILDSTNSTISHNKTECDNQVNLIKSKLENLENNMIEGFEIYDQRQSELEIKITDLSTLTKDNQTTDKKIMVAMTSNINSNASEIDGLHKIINELTTKLSTLESKLATCTTTGQVTSMIEANKDSVTKLIDSSKTATISQVGTLIETSKNTIIADCVAKYQPKS
jgi:hypothetical protein